MYVVLALRPPPKRETMSGTAKEILKSTVSLGSVLTLLLGILSLAASGAWGVWQCKDTLDRINTTLADHTQKLETTSSDTKELKDEYWQLKWNQQQQGYVLTDIQHKVDSTDKKVHSDN